MAVYGQQGTIVASQKLAVSQAAYRGRGIAAMENMEDSRQIISVCTLEIRVLLWLHHTIDSSSSICIEICIADLTYSIL